MRTVILIGATVVIAGCMVDGSSGIDSALSKDEVRAQAKADHDLDYCAEFGWYDDGVCDVFCPAPDPDCGDDTFCLRALCGPGTVCDEELDACIPDPNQDFCSRVRCMGGTRCDEDLNACVPIDDDLFCARVLCAPGTLCDEASNACVPIDNEPFCARADCAPGFWCDEQLNACVRDCPLTGIVCTPECPESGRLPGGAPCTAGEYDAASCECRPVA